MKKISPFKKIILFFASLAVFYSYLEPNSTLEVLKYLFWTAFLLMFVILTLASFFSLMILRLTVEILSSLIF